MHFKKINLLIAIYLVVSGPLPGVRAIAQDLSAGELINLSIKYHDPENKWMEFAEYLNLKQESPDGEEKRRKVFLDRKNSHFTFESQLKGGLLKYEVLGNSGKYFWNNSETLPDSIAKKYRISPERAVMYRNYYSYLYGMPMKLKDPGTILDPKVESVLFHGKEYYKIKVTYEEGVGGDTWYFYFDKSTFALGAYEFWKKEPGDGEYLLLEGMKEIGGIKLPEKIAWYYTEGDKWLGTDILE